MALQLTKTKNKNGAFTYQVLNDAGQVIAKRYSKRDYIACTACGNFFFSRLDLIGKGDSKRFFDLHPEQRDNIAYLTNDK